MKLTQSIFLIGNEKETAKMAHKVAKTVANPAFVLDDVSASERVISYIADNRSVFLSAQAFDVLSNEAIDAFLGSEPEVLLLLDSFRELPNELKVKLFNCGV